MIKVNSHELFVERIWGRGIEPLEEWRGSSVKIKLRCYYCKNEWDAAPNGVLCGRGCPLCARRRAGFSQRRQNRVLRDAGDYLVIDISGPKYPGATMLIDHIDWELIRGTGRVCVGANGYPSLGVAGRARRVHRLLLPGTAEVDHINGVITDNRRCNLRACTRSQNNINRTTLKQNNTSGYCGVSWSKSAGKWHAYLCKDGARVLSQYFSKKEDAIKARREAEQRYFGEFAPVRNRRANAK